MNECTPGCRICSHPQRAQIDAALAAGNSLRAVAKTFEGTNKDILARHWRLSKGTVLSSADSTVRLNNLKSRIEKNLQKAEKAEDFKTVATLQAQLLEIESKLALQPQREQAKVQTNPNWIKAVRAALGFDDAARPRTVDGRTGEVRLHWKDKELVRQLELAAEARKDDPHFLAVTARLISLIGAVPLDAETEAEVSKYEGEDEDESIGQDQGDGEGDPRELGEGRY